MDALLRGLAPSALLVVSTPALAAFKCIAEDGSVYIGDTYGDRANCAKVATPPPETNVMDSGSGAKEETMNSLYRQRAQQIANKIESGAYKYDNDCKFKYFTEGDSEGQALARAAKRECLYNKYMGAEIPTWRPSYEAQDRWAEHFKQEKVSRQERVERAVDRANENYNRTMDRIERDQQHREVMRGLEGIRECVDRNDFGCY